MPEIDDDDLEAELDALGDDLAFDTDSSYLDDAISAPNAPDSVPGADSVTNKVSKNIPTYIVLMNSMKLVIPLHSLYWSIHTKDESKLENAFAFIFGVN